MQISVHDAVPEIKTIEPSSIRAAVDKLAVSSALSRREESIGDSLIAAKCQAREIGANCAAEAVLEPVARQIVKWPEGQQRQVYGPRQGLRCCGASSVECARFISRFFTTTGCSIAAVAASTASRACSGKQQKCSVRI